MSISEKTRCQREWETLCEHLEVSKQEQTEWWERLSKMYSTSTRHYHSLTHLEHMFSTLDEVNELLSRPEIVKLAVFFHDAIYDARSKTNEEDSAQLSREFAEDAGQGQQDADLVFNYIIATKSHAVEPQPEGEGGEERGDLLLFLDADMAILGEENEAYDAYTRTVRQEYGHLSNEEWDKGRAAVLASFLAKEYIYATQEMRDLYEANARANVTRELESLSKEPRPHHEGGDGGGGVAGAESTQEAPHAKADSSMDGLRVDGTQAGKRKRSPTSRQDDSEEAKTSSS